MQVFPTSAYLLPVERSCFLLDVQPTVETKNCTSWGSSCCRRAAIGAEVHQSHGQKTEAARHNVPRLTLLPHESAQRLWAISWLGVGGGGLLSRRELHTYGHGVTERVAREHRAREFVREGGKEDCGRAQLKNSCALFLCKPCSVSQPTSSHDIPSAPTSTPITTTTCNPSSSRCSPLGSCRRMLMPSPLKEKTHGSRGRACKHIVNAHLPPAA